MPHIPVLLEEVLQFANPKPGEYFIDATIGTGGYAKEILKKIYPGGKLLAIDLDNNAIMKIKKKFKKEIEMNILRVECGNFASIKEIARKNGFFKINGIIADLGMSSEQLEESGRGFSFKKEEPLLMTYSSEPAFNSLTAEKIVNQLSEKDLSRIFKEFGEEKYANRYAREIIRARRIKPITSSKELAEIITRVSPKRKYRLHPATRVFQAIRIVVNNELENLKLLIGNGFEILASQGRMVIISYHSLEDRIVKQEFKKLVLDKIAISLTKKPVRPSQNEINLNPRSRSAKLRAIQKI